MTTYPLSMLKRAFLNELKHYTTKNLQQLITSQLPEHYTPPRAITRITASTVPTAPLRELLTTHIAFPNLITYFKPAENHLELYKIILSMLNDTLPDIATRIVLIEDKQEKLNIALKNSELLVASASNQTMEILRQKALSFNIPLLEHPNKISFAILTRQTTDLNTQLQSFCMDFITWYKSGCLSPQALFIEKHDPNTIINALTQYIEKYLQSEPAPPLSIDEQIQHNTALLSMALSAKITRISRFALALYPSKPENNTHKFPSLLPYTLDIVPVDNIKEILDLLHPILYQTNLASALASSTPLKESQSKAFKKLGFTYFCPFGHMQNPPLSWIHDGIGDLAPLIQPTIKNNKS